jgi:hypothetical protein
MLLVHPVEGQAARILSKLNCFLFSIGQGVTPPTSDPVFITASFKFPNTHELDSA